MRPMTQVLFKYHSSLMEGVGASVQLCTPKVLRLPTEDGHVHHGWLL